MRWFQRYGRNRPAIAVVLTFCCSPAILFICYAFSAFLRSRINSASAAIATARYSGRLLLSPVGILSRTVRVTSRLMIRVPAASATTHLNLQPFHFFATSSRDITESVKPGRSTHFPRFSSQICHWYA